MRKSITRTIRHRKNEDGNPILTIANGKWMEDNRELNFPTPRKDYTVTYMANPEGNYELSGEIVYHTSGRDMPVCFLRGKFPNGTRFTRKVREKREE